MKTKIMFCTLAIFLFAFTGSVFGGFEGNENTFYGTGAGHSTVGDDDSDTFIGVGAGYSVLEGKGYTVADGISRVHSLLVPKLNVTEPLMQPLCRPLKTISPSRGLRRYSCRKR